MLMVAERAEVEPEPIQNLARATIDIAFAGIPTRIAKFCCQSAKHMLEL